MTPDALSNSNSAPLPLLPAKLVFNPSAGRHAAHPELLSEIIAQLRAWQIEPQVYIVGPEGRTQSAVRQALQQGIELIIVCGGDGTVDVVAGALAGTSGTLGIIPCGTQNNIAHTLGIPHNDLAGAVALLRTGQRLKMDIGHARCGRNSRWFMEFCAVGLVSALFSDADGIQHGDLARLGDLLAKLVTFEAANITLSLDDGQQVIRTQGHIVLMANIPRLGFHFQVAPDISFQDSHMDVLVFSHLSKLELLGIAVQATTGGPEDPRIRHYRARNAVVRTVPAMPIMADGEMLGSGRVKISVQGEGIAVMAGAGAQTKPAPFELHREEVPGMP